MASDEELAALRQKAQIDALLLQILNLNWQIAQLCGEVEALTRQLKDSQCPPQ